LLQEKATTINKKEAMRIGISDRDRALLELVAQMENQKRLEFDATLIKDTEETQREIDLIKAVKNVEKAVDNIEPLTIEQLIALKPDNPYPDLDLSGLTMSGLTVPKLEMGTDMTSILSQIESNTAQTAQKIQDALSLS
jgi:hypothetical protein